MEMDFHFNLVVKTTYLHKIPREMPLCRPFSLLRQAFEQLFQLPPNPLNKSHQEVLYLMSFRTPVSLLSAGIFPREAKHYEFDNETKKLTVTLPTICEVSYRDSSVLRFSTSVTGHIEKGKISEIEGLKTRIVIWVKVTCIVCEEMNLHFTAGLGKTRSRKVYEMVRDGITVDKF
ncbi:Protein of unknown function DUF538 [Cynara cardunculus var. scolymus]|uniref:Uncharacterized protein n=1 Tax=Cynara cardunculus var. scolymus TaxID=59895 RepID=A0A124SFH8_CYNCS|nr:Protein of unknown function DUF538 [Cynara cardunculus var. scolymus]